MSYLIITVCFISITESYIGIAIAFIGLQACFISVAMGFIALASTLISVADYFSEGFLAINSVFGSVISTQLGLNRTATGLNTMLRKVLGLASTPIKTAGKYSEDCRFYFWR